MSTHDLRSGVNSGPKLAERLDQARKTIADLTAERDRLKSLVSATVAARDTAIADQKTTSAALQTVAWRRITVAVDSGAPVPYSIHIHGGHATIAYIGPQSADPLADAAAMARALGLAEGPIRGTDTVRWRTSTDEWEATGDSWSVWAHLPEAAVPDGVDGASIGTRHGVVAVQQPSGGAD